MVSGNLLDALPNPYDEETREPHKTRAQHLHILAEARQSLLEYNARNNEATNLTRKCVPLKVGDSVFYRSTPRAKSRPFTGPFKSVKLDQSTATQCLFGFSKLVLFIHDYLLLGDFKNRSGTDSFIFAKKKPSSG